MEESEVKLRERLAQCESSLKSLHKRVDHVEELVEGMYKMTTEIQHMREDLNRAVKNIDDLKSKPAQRWDSLIGAVLGALAGGLGTMLISNVLGG